MYVDAFSLAKAALDYAARRGRALKAVTVVGGRTEDRLDRRVKDALVSLGHPSVEVSMHKAGGPARIYSLEVSTSHSEEGLSIPDEAPPCPPPHDDPEAKDGG